MENDTKKYQGLVWRGCVTLALIALWSWLSTTFTAAAQLQVGEASVGQLENSDAAYLNFVWINKFFNCGFLPWGILALVLLAVWWKPLSKLLKGLAVVALCSALSLTMLPNDAKAYYEKKDLAEWVEIGANESAFLIPLTGANKDKQKQFGSVAYLNENKIAAKRVQIPHVKLENSTGMLQADYYGPASKLFLLDRTPYMREWTKSATKGTSAQDQGFRFESAESITVETSIIISAYVKEEDAATFFYWFGSRNPPAKTPEETFASVSYARSLSDVMDTVVRGKVQAMLAKEFGKRKLADAIGSKSEIIDAVEKAVRDEFAAQGITIKYVGYADELKLPESIQVVVDEMFAANLKYANRTAIDTVIALDQRRAEIEVTQAKAKTMVRWDGKLNFPSFMVMSDKFMEWLSGVFGGAKK